MKNDVRGVGMNAVEFVKDHGIEEAKRIASESPEGGASYNYIFEKYSDGMTKKGLYWVQVNHLKRLVRSWELVEYEGGLIKAKNVLFLKRALGLTPHADRLEQAIADVESVGGGV